MSNEIIPKAAEYLDAIYKDDRCCRTQLENWRSKIDLSTLEMWSTYKCILGQLFGDYVDGEDKLRGWEYSWGVDTPTYGKVKLEDVEDAFAGFNKEWKAYLSPAKTETADEAVTYLKSNYGPTVFKVVGKVKVDDIEWYVTLVGREVNGQFKATSRDGDPKLYPASDFEEYRPWAPSEKPTYEVGKFYTSADRKFVGWYEKEGRMVAILGSNFPGTTENPRAAFAEPEYYSGRYGQLYEIKNPGGSEWTTVTGLRP